MNGNTYRADPEYIRTYPQHAGTCVERCARCGEEYGEHVNGACPRGGDEEGEG